MISQTKIIREKPIPEGKLELVKELRENIEKYRTTLIASCKGLPGKQFHEIKKKLRGLAEIKVARKSAVARAIDGIEKGAVKNLKKELHADIILLFSDLDPFELSGILTENESNRKSKAGDISPKDIEIEPGMTDLVPGPAISELGSVGLKIKVTDGKLEITKGAIIAHEGDEITDVVASVLGKLDVFPIKVGFIPLAAYDSKDDKVYVGIKIDKPGTLEELRAGLGRALGFAITIDYAAKETMSYFISKAFAEEKALEALFGKEPEKKEEAVEEKPVEEAKDEEKKEEPVENPIEEDTKEDA